MSDLRDESAELQVALLLFVWFCCCMVTTQTEVLVSGACQIKPILFFILNTGVLFSLAAVLALRANACEPY